MALLNREEDGSWTVKIRHQCYSLEEIPDPGCPAVLECREELEAGGLHPRDLLNMISKTIACLKISIHGFAAAGDWKSQNELYTLGLGMADMLGEIETTLWKMKVATDDILSNMQIAVLYCVDGYEGMAKENFRFVSSKAEEMINDCCEPLERKIEAKRDELQKSEVFKSWRKKLTTLESDRDAKRKEFRNKSNWAEDERVRIDRGVGDADRKKSAAEGEWFQWFRGTAKRIQSLEKDRRDFLNLKEDIERELRRMKESVDALDGDPQWLVLPLVDGAMKSMIGYFNKQQQWWKEIVVFLRPKLESASTIGDEPSRNVFKLKIIKMYFLLVAVGSLAMHSKKYLHKCNHSFGRTIAENPTQEQGERHLKSLIDRHEEDTEALVSGIEEEVEREIQEYEKRLRQRNQQQQGHQAPETHSWQQPQMLQSNQQVHSYVAPETHSWQQPQMLQSNQQVHSYVAPETHSWQQPQMLQRNLQRQHRVAPETHSWQQPQMLQRNQQVQSYVAPETHSWQQPQMLLRNLQLRINEASATCRRQQQELQRNIGLIQHVHHVQPAYYGGPAVSRQQQQMQQQTSEWPRLRRKDDDQEQPQPKQQHRQQRKQEPVADSTNLKVVAVAVAVVIVVVLLFCYR